MQPGRKQEVLTGMAQGAETVQKLQFHKKLGDGQNIRVCHVQGQLSRLCVVENESFGMLLLTNRGKGCGAQQFDLLGSHQMTVLAEERTPSWIAGQRRAALGTVLVAGISPQLNDPIDVPRFRLEITDQVAQRGGASGDLLDS